MATITTRTVTNDNDRRMGASAAVLETELAVVAEVEEVAEAAEVAAVAAARADDNQQRAAK
jgi:hypothetical protein